MTNTKNKKLNNISLIKTKDLAQMIITMEKNLNFTDDELNDVKNIKSKISNTSFKQLKKSFNSINNKKINIKKDGFPASIYYLMAFITMDTLQSNTKTIIEDEIYVNDLNGRLEKIITNNPLIVNSTDPTNDINKVASALRNNNTKFLSDIINGSKTLNFYYEFINKFPIPQGFNAGITSQTDINFRNRQLRYKNFEQLIYLCPDLLNYQTVTGPASIYVDLPISIRATMLFCDLAQYPVNWSSYYEGANHIKLAFEYIRNHEPLKIINKITIKHRNNSKNENYKVTTKLSTIFNQLQFEDSNDNLADSNDNLADSNDNLADILYESKFNDFILNNYHDPSLSYKDIDSLITTIIPAYHKITNMKELSSEYPGPITIQNPKSLINLMPKNISKKLDDYIFEHFDISYGNSINSDAVPFSPFDIWTHSDSYQDIINTKSKYILDRFIELSNSLSDDESIDKLAYLLSIVNPNDLANIVNAVSYDKIKNIHDHKDAIALLKSIK